MIDISSVLKNILGDNNFNGSETIQVTVPTRYLSYLINDDCTSFTQDDALFMDSFMQNVKRFANGRRWYWGEYRDRGFTYYNDVHNLADECVVIDLVFFGD